MTEQTFAAGHVFFRAGDPGDRAYLLGDGQVELLTGAAGTLARVRLLQAGDVFGETALIEERPRSLTARAVSAGKATALTREEFERDLTLTPPQTQKHLRSLFERLRSLTARHGGEVEPVRVAPIDALDSVKKPSHSAPAELPSGGKATGWVVVVHPLTRKAAETLPDDGLTVTRFPLRIGRITEAHEREALDLNDLWLLDAKPYNVSRNHCEILVDNVGPLVCDRGVTSAVL